MKFLCWNDAQSFRSSRASENVNMKFLIHFEGEWLQETKRPSREMQLTISTQLNLDPTTVWICDLMMNVNSSYLGKNENIMYFRSLISSWMPVDVVTIENVERNMRGTKEEQLVCYHPFILFFCLFTYRNFRHLITIPCRFNSFFIGVSLRFTLLIRY